MRQYKPGYTASPKKEITNSVTVYFLAATNYILHKNAAVSSFLPLHIHTLKFDLCF